MGIDLFMFIFIPSQIYHSCVELASSVGKDDVQKKLRSDGAAS